MEDVSRQPLSEPRVTRLVDNLHHRDPLPGYDPKSSTQSLSSSLLESFHFSMLFSLADGFNEEAIAEAEPTLANNLRNLRDHDIGIFSNATEYIGRGATFSVRRTLFGDSKNVVFKSRVPNPDEDGNTPFMQKIEAILLELRVLTHSPLRNHDNIVRLIQVGWEGDALDKTIKWPVLIVDFADRGTLADFFENETIVDFSTKLAISLDVAKGLQALHDCQIVHGDLKLLNVLVYSDDDRHVVAKLSDFGGALLDSPDILAKPMGTPPWTAPEYDTLRSRGDLLKSDIYALGLLIWQVMISGNDPFCDDSIFDVPRANIDRLDAIKQWKQSNDFLNKAKTSIYNYARDVDCDIVFKVLDSSLQGDRRGRDLDRVISCLQDIQEVERESQETSQSEIESLPELGSDESTGLRLSLAGLDIQNVTRSLSSRVLESFAHIAQYDEGLTRRAEAAFLLAKIHLGSDDFGLPLDIDRGLQYLTISAKSGSREDQALILRMHHAFGREVPNETCPLISGWLLAAGATGSMTALEDMKEFGYEKELLEALRLLKTRYCGTGEEVFEFEEEAVAALVDSYDTKGREYIVKELEKGRAKGTDLRGYLLRLSAAYGSASAIEYLVSDLQADIDGQNDFGDSAILLAARSGHCEALLKLLHWGADPRSSDMGGDTAMHWLCSFDEEDCDGVADELVRRGANINAQASTFPIYGRLEYAETEFVAGTPLHRAICRNKLRQVQKLLKLGADIYAPAGDDLDQTPIALAALLHYPRILDECLSSGNGRRSEKLLTPSGKSLLIPAIAGGSINRISIGRLIRHGAYTVERAIQTMSMLCEAGASDHLSDLPGMPGCTAIFYASRYQAHIVEWISLNGPRDDIDRPSKRPNDEGQDGEEDMLWPPLFEAILYGKSEVAQRLLDVGADARARQSDQSPVTALYQCAETSFQDIAIAQELCKRGVRVDDGPSGHETPFQCAVRNSCYALAQFLRDMGADVNALSSSGLMWRSSREQTLLCLLARNNSPSSISGLQFLLDGTSEVSILVEPSLNHTVFHILAMLGGDCHDGLTTTRALDLCKDYFEPSPEDLNLQSVPHEHGDASVESEGGNTALHYAVIHANFPVVDFLLRKCIGMDTSIKNAYGMTALDLATLSYPSFEKRFKPRDIPKSPTRQLKAAKIARDEIMQLLMESTPSGVTRGVEDKYTLDDSEAGG